MHSFNNILLLQKVPPRIANPLRFLVENFHDLVTEAVGVPAAITTSTCPMTSWIACQFLQAINVRADLLPVKVVVEGSGYRLETRHEEHCLEANQYGGHVVVLTTDLLIDLTLAQFNRPNWPTLPDQLIWPINRRPEIHNQKILEVDSTMITPEAPDWALAYFYAQLQQEELLSAVAKFNASDVEAGVSALRKAWSRRWLRSAKRRA